MRSLGSRIRHQRTRMGLSLDDLAGRSGVSKAYLSLIETGRVANPPSDAKLRQIEQALDFPPGQLLTQAHVMRTPRDVRSVLQSLLEQSAGPPPTARTQATSRGAPPPNAARGTIDASPDASTRTRPAAQAPASGELAIGIDLDAAYLTGILQQWVDQSATNIEPIATQSVPVINRVSAGYPKDFTDLSYPRGMADDFIGGPNLQDPDAFAARVHGDSMAPRYAEGDVVVFSPAADPASGDDCFVRFDDGHTTFKRVHFETDPAGRSVIRLQPRNDRYRAQTVPAEQITGVYKAVFRYERLG